MTIGMALASEKETTAFSFSLGGGLGESEGK
jgi:hypothetical protein